jgi:hypothetical protein
LQNNNIRLFHYDTHVRKHEAVYFEKVKKAIQIYNYENVVVEDYYFSSWHMNDRGARKFTEIVINDFFVSNHASSPFLHR